MKVLHSCGKWEVAALSQPEQTHFVIYKVEMSQLLVFQIIRFQILCFFPSGPACGLASESPVAVLTGNEKDETSRL